MNISGPSFGIPASGGPGSPSQIPQTGLPSQGGMEGTPVLSPGGGSIPAIGGPGQGQVGTPVQGPGGEVGTPIQGPGGGSVPVTRGAGGGGVPPIYVGTSNGQIPLDEAITKSLGPKGAEMVGPSLSGAIDAIPESDLSKIDFNKVTVGVVLQQIDKTASDIGYLTSKLEAARDTATQLHTAFVMLNELSAQPVSVLSPELRQILEDLSRKTGQDLAPDSKFIERGEAQQLQQQLRGLMSGTNQQLGALATELAQLNQKAADLQQILRQMGGGISAVLNRP